MIDYHLHTDHSGDGKTPLDAMIQGAIAAHCKEVCITSHYDALYPLWPQEDYEPDLGAYYRDIAEAAHTYRDRIVVRAGVELGLQAWRSDVLAITEKALEGIPFDFCLGSLHCLSPKAVPDESAYWQNQTRASFVSHMLEHLIFIAENYACFDVMGHLTYFSRYCPFEDKRQMVADAPEKWDALFETLIERGKGIEINTSAKRKFGFFMPDLDIAKRYREKGGEIVTIGSDAHVPGDIAQYHIEARNMLKEAGFRYFCTFIKRKPQFVKL